MIPALTLLALLVVAGTGDRTGRPGAVALALLSLAWLLVNGSVEGILLWTFSTDHGLTGADLTGLAGLALAAWRFHRSSARGLSGWWRRTRTPGG